MQTGIILVLICALFSSCATILNKEKTSSTIYSQSAATIIVNQDTVITVNNKTTLVLERSKDPLEITILTDTLMRKVSVNARGSMAYRMNIYNYGLGLLLDYNNKKRYNYPSKIYLNPQDTIKGYSLFGEANNKGDFFLHVSIPYVNSFLFTPDDETQKVSTGFMGISLGMDYYHSEKQFLSFTGSGVLAFLAPVPAPVHYGGIREHFSSAFISLSNNHKIRRFSSGYGISLANNIWNLRNHGDIQMEIYPPIVVESVLKRNNAIGLLFSTYFQTGQYFNIGLVYRPTFIRLNTIRDLRYQYEHLISLDLAWKVILKR